MAGAKESFFTSIGCMDGRVQEPVTRFGQEKFGAQYPDTITEAGLVGKLSGEPSSSYLENLKTKLDISLQKHHSVGVIVHGHEDCAGHPVENQQHKKDILVAAYRLQALLGNAIKVIPVFVRKVGEEWMVETLVEMTESL